MAAATDLNFKHGHKILNSAFFKYKNSIATINASFLKPEKHCFCPLHFFTSHNISRLKTFSKP